MASYAGVLSVVDKQLAASTLDTITLTPDYPLVEILSDGAAKIYATTDGTTPTVGGANTWVLPASPCTRKITAPYGDTTVVKLISAGTPVYSVMGLK